MRFHFPIPEWIRTKYSDCILKPVRIFFQFSPVVSLLISLFVLLSLVGLRSSRSLEPFELAAYDWSIKLRPAVPLSTSRVVLIQITEEDIHNQEHWPLSDADLARVLTMLIHYKPRVIGLDLFRDIAVPPGYGALEAVLKSERNIIVVEKSGSEEETAILPPAALKNTQQVGFNDVLVDPDGIIRRGLFFMDDGKEVSYAFALRAALLYLAAEGITPQSDTLNPQHMRLGNTTIRPFEPNDGGYVDADAQGYQFLLDFREQQESFPSFSLTDVLSGEVNLAVIKDKIVLIGTAAVSVKDFFYTPYNRGLRTNKHIPGIVLHAHIVSQLLRFALDNNSPLIVMREWHEWCLIFLWSALGTAIGLRARTIWSFSLVAIGGLLILGFAAYFALLGGWWVPVVPPALAWLISATLVTVYMSNREKEQRELLMQLFSRHVSPEIAETIWQQRDQFLNDGRPHAQKLTATVLFSDLAGFTTVSEKMDPLILMDWLNTYLETMARLVSQHGGIVDDYAGDGLKGDFGVPLARTSEAEICQDAVNAVNCALAMREELTWLNKQWQKRNLPRMSVRIGIFTGPVVAGSLGSAQHLKYTTVGDTVNVASRLESVEMDPADSNTAGSSCRIIIGEATLRYLGHQFKTQRVGEVKLKGKEQKITAYCIVDRDNDASNHHTPRGLYGGLYE